MAPISFLWSHRILVSTVSPTRCLIGSLQLGRIGHRILASPGFRDLSPRTENRMDQGTENEMEPETI